MRSSFAALLAVGLASIGCVAPASEEVGASEDRVDAKGCQVLVAMSDASTLHAVGATILNRRHTKDFEFGYLLDEMAIPVQALLDAGCKVTFATPSGTEPPRDLQGDRALYFTDGLPVAQGTSLLDVAVAKLRIDALVPRREAYEELERALTLVTSDASPIRGGGPGSFDAPIRFADLVGADGEGRAGALSRYDAVFVPGGYAPMLNLWNDRQLGGVLRWFHGQSRLTVTLCRGGVALASAAKGGAWPYQGYRVATYATVEDDVASLMGGVLPFYDLPFHPNHKVRDLGARLDLDPFHPHVVQDRELLTGENQWSAHALAARFVAALRERGALDGR